MSRSVSPHRVDDSGNPVLLLDGLRPNVSYAVELKMVDETSTSRRSAVVYGHTAPQNPRPPDSVKCYSTMNLEISASWTSSPKNFELEEPIGRYRVQLTQLPPQLPPSYRTCLHGSICTTSKHLKGIKVPQSGWYKLSVYACTQPVACPMYQTVGDVSESPKKSKIVKKYQINTEKIWNNHLQSSVLDRVEKSRIDSVPLSLHGESGKFSPKNFSENIGILANRISRPILLENTPKYVSEDETGKYLKFIDDDGRPRDTHNHRHGLGAKVPSSQHAENVPTKKHYVTTSAKRYKRQAARTAILGGGLCELCSLVPTRTLCAVRGDVELDSVSDVWVEAAPDSVSHMKKKSRESAILGKSLDETTAGQDVPTEGGNHLAGEKDLQDSPGNEAKGNATEYNSILLVRWTPPQSPTSEILFYELLLTNHTGEGQQQQQRSLSPVPASLAQTGVALTGLSPGNYSVSVSAVNALLKPSRPKAHYFQVNVTLSAVLPRSECVLHLPPRTSVLPLSPTLSSSSTLPQWLLGTALFCSVMVLCCLKKAREVNQRRRKFSALPLTASEDINLKEARSLAVDVLGKDFVWDPEDVNLNLVQPTEVLLGAGVNANVVRGTAMSTKHGMGAQVDVAVKIPKKLQSVSDVKKLVHEAHMIRWIRGRRGRDWRAGVAPPRKVKFFAEEEYKERPRRSYGVFSRDQLRYAGMAPVFLPYDPHCFRPLGSHSNSRE
ncbi:Fibronectin type III [Trinorchestia longiramus]|nr:Fibronectin type III [Trinorchestia longiramus]